MNIKFYSIFTVFLLFSVLAYAQVPGSNTAVEAVALVPNTGTCTPSATVYTTEEATQSIVAPGQGTDDVWFKFVAGATGARITLSDRVTIGGGSWQPRIDLWSGAPNEGDTYWKPDGITHHDLWVATVMGADALFNYAYLSAPLTPGATYYIRIYGGVSAARGQFKICVEDVPIPVNDFCWSAQTLTLGNGAACTNTVNGSTFNAVSGDNNLAFCQIGSTSARDVWYKFVATDAKVAITLSNISLADGTSSNLGIQLSGVSPDAANGTCNGTTFACGDNFSPLVYQTLTPGATYYIRVFNTDIYSASTFTICATVPSSPVNDDCTGALTLPISSSAVATSLLTGSSRYGGSSTAPITCSGTILDDVWFKFTPTAQQVAGGTLAIYSPLSFKFALYTGSCGSLAQVSGWCGDTEANSNLPTLTAGTTYYLRAYGLAGTDYAISLITLTPQGDICADAVDISSTAISGYVKGHTKGATVTAGLENCYGYPQGTDYDVWFKTTVNAPGTYIVDIKNLVSHNQFPAPNPDVQVQVFKGDCSGSIEFCNYSYRNQPLPAIVVGSVPTTYYIRIIDVANAPGWNSFDIAFKPISTPDNDEPANAVSLVQDLSCNPVSGTLYNATLSADPVADFTGDSPKSDVWYKFVAVSANPKIELKNISGGVKMALYAGTPSGTSSIGGTTIINATGLTIGQIYYVRVYKTIDFPTNPSQANFNICVTGYPTNQVADNVSTCETTDQTLVSNNSNSWLHFTRSGKLVLSVFDGPAHEGQTFAQRGNITATFYTHTGAIRTNDSSIPYLDRNFGISVQNNNLNNDVRFRFYLSKTELDNLINASGSEVGNISDLKIARLEGASCNTAIGSSAIVYNMVGFGNVSPDVYYIEGITPDFSGFFLMNAPVNETLPVTCDVFTASSVKDGIALNWTTKTETNSKQYEIYRTTNGVNYQLIKTLTSHNSTSGSIYSYTDKVKAGVTYYYLLKQVDMDGAVQDVCNRVNAVWNGLASSSLLVYPNPAKDKISIALLQTNTKTTYKVQIFNTTGDLIYERKHGSTDTEISIAKFSNGLYTIKVSSKEGVFTSKFVKAN